MLLSIYVSWDLCYIHLWFFGSLNLCSMQVSMFLWICVSMVLCFYRCLFQVERRLHHTFQTWKVQVICKVQKNLSTNAWKMGKLIGKRHNWVKNLMFGFCKANILLVIFKCSIQHNIKCFFQVWKWHKILWDMFHLLNLDVRKLDLWNMDFWNLSFQNLDL